MLRVTTSHLTVVAALAWAYACGSGEPLRVTTFQLGRSLNPDKTVATHTTRFKPDDTIYVSVLTEGSGSGTIGARWSYASRVVSEPSQQVSYKGAAATEFHIQNSGGFPPGNYAVEIVLNGESVGRRDFRVEK